MSRVSKTHKSILVVALVVTLIALYINKTQYNYAISVALILMVLITSISGVMTYRSETCDEKTSGAHSRLAVTILILLCTAITIYLVKVSSEPIFSETSPIDSSAVLADLTRS